MKDFVIDDVGNVDFIMDSDDDDCRRFMVNVVIVYYILIMF